jgi:hypothetical protein
MRGPITDHEEIRRWAESRKAFPAEVFPRLFDSEPAVLRFVFGKPLVDEENGIRVITWENFFALFDLMGLSLVYDSDHQYELLQIEAKSPYRFDGKPV